MAVRTDRAPLECVRSKTDGCKGLEKSALRLQEFRFTIQPWPGIQQKHVDALSRPSIPVESDQQPIVLEEFPECVVLLPLSREWHEPALCPLGVTWLEALWRCRVKVIKALELAADENARVQTSETSRLRPGNHVALRLSTAERQAEGKFSPLFKGPYVIVPVKPAGVTADIRCLVTGHMAKVNRCRLKFLEAIPQHALHLKRLPRAVFH